MNILSVPEIQKIDDKTLYAYCQYVGRQARTWKNHFVALLPEVAKRGIHKTHGFATIVEFAAKVGGVGQKTVEAVFQVENLLNDKPALKNLVPEIGVNKVRIVATIATTENQNLLAKKVKEMSKSALEVWTREVRLMREQGLLNEKLENTRQDGNGHSQKDLAENLAGNNNLDRCTSQTQTQNQTQQNLFNVQTGSINPENISEDCPFPPGRSKREKYSFGLDENVSFKLRFFKHKLEKAKKIALEWNDVIDELLKIAFEQR